MSVVGQDFYYYLITIAVLGFWASAYTFVHTSKRTWEHKASVVMFTTFSLTILVGILGVGGDLPVDFKEHFSLWFVGLVVLYVSVKAIDRWAFNYERRMQLCKDKEFLRQMRKAGKSNKGVEDV